MRLLIVEDDGALRQTLREEIAAPGVEIIEAASREAAQTALEDTTFDLVLCDLKLPSRNGTLDEDTAHGLAVVADLRARYPGTPILILSAVGTTEQATEQMRDAPQLDVVGDHTVVGMVNYRTKRELSQCIDTVRDFCQRLARTDAIQVDTRGRNIPVSRLEARILRIFARRLDGAIVEVQAAPAGLSGSRVFWVRIETAAGGTAAHVIAKIGKIPTVEEERRRHSLYANPILPPGAYAPLAGYVQGGAADVGGLFYRAAAGYQSLFSALRAGQPIQPVLQRLRAGVGPWLENPPRAQATMAELRGRLVRDDAFAAVSNEHGVSDECLQLESCAVHHYQVPQHGDLHGENILIDSEGTPLLIDFAEAGPALAALDPVVLELSLLFHPAAADLREEWPMPDSYESWVDLDAFLEGSPAALNEFVRSCREWAYSVARSDMEVIAAAYCYVVRQLKYPDTDKRAVAGLLRGLVAQVRE